MQLHYWEAAPSAPARGSGQELSREARLQLQWMGFWRTHGHNAALTCRHFGISRQAFYRWKRRHDPRYLSRLDPRWPQLNGAVERAHRTHTEGLY